MVYSFSFRGLLALLLTSHAMAQVHVEDPLEPILRPALRSTVEVMLETYQARRNYRDEDFPLPRTEFEAFRRRMIERFVASVGLEQWVVPAPSGKQSPLREQFVDRRLKTIQHHGVEMEVHVIQILATGMTVPVVLCLPPGTDRRPGVCVFSGHTQHGLRDLVLDLDSYQSGVAVRLAKAGFATVAVEKIDTGYLSRDGRVGNDELPVATFGLYWGRPTRAHQLMACVAASEVLASHPRVDHTRIGATGVSLGGWLSVQTALLSDRIRAVADFGVKTVTVTPEMTAESFQGMPDLCHILPGMLSVSDRNLMNLAYCPRPMLASHGQRHRTSHAQGPVHYRSIFTQQYAELGAADQYEYHVHDGGDTMPAQVAIDYFRRKLMADASSK